LAPKALIPKAGRKKTDNQSRNVHCSDKLTRFESKKFPTKKIQIVKRIKKPDINRAVEVEQPRRISS